MHTRRLHLGALVLDAVEHIYLFKDAAPSACVVAVAAIFPGHFTLPGHLSEHSRSLIVRMLTVDPSKRITVKEIRLAS